MKTTTEVYEDRIEEKKSLFISYLTPISKYKTLLEDLKSKHPKARHFVTATRELNEFDQIVESFSDDGEPKGTSGMPTLKVLAGNEMINVGIITVRYFGGTLLGTGGLVRAYSDAANRVILSSKLQTYIKFEKEVVNIPFALSSKAEYLAKNLDVNIEEREFHQNGIKLHIKATSEQLKLFNDKIE